MSARVDENERHIFPRWRSFEATAALGELARPAKLVSIDTTDLDISLANGIASWEMNRSLWHDLDLLGTAAVAGKLDSFAALISEVKNNPQTPPFAKETLERAGGKKEGVQLPLPEYEKVPGSKVRRDVRSHRTNLIDSPHDPIEWVELARAYTVAGEDRKAERAVRAALQLAPNNRYVLRCAARFFIHVGEPEIARALLNSAELVNIDPWLMASEIAISDFLGKPSKLPKIGRQTLERDMSPRDLTELASALGSLEASHGNDRAARRLLRQSVNGANENSVAQIRWLNRAHLGEAVDVSGVSPPLLHEANSWAAFYKGDFDCALSEALSWLADQPFASAPAVLGSFILSDLMWDFEAAREVAEAGLMANPNDSMLLNNLAVILMELNRLVEAEGILERITTTDKSNNSDVTFSATHGMLEFRKGNADLGRKLYLEAIDRSKSSGEKADVARALFHLAFEEIRSNSDEIELALQRLKAIEDLKDLVEIPRHLRRIRDLLEGKGRGQSPT